MNVPYCIHSPTDQHFFHCLTITNNIAMNPPIDLFLGKCSRVFLGQTPGNRIFESTCSYLH